MVCGRNGVNTESSSNLVLNHKYVIALGDYVSNILSDTSKMVQFVHLNVFAGFRTNELCQEGFKAFQLPNI